MFSKAIKITKENTPACGTWYLLNAHLFIKLYLNQLQKRNQVAR